MKLQDYIHYYLGCRVKATPYGGQANKWEEGSIVGLNIHNVAHVKFDNWQSIADVTMSCIKPILRRLEDMTEEEARGFLNHAKPYAEYIAHNEHAVIWQSQGSRSEIWLLFGPPAGFHYLLKQHFDLFGLIDAQLAVDAKTIG
jgi:hypothetical protein